MTNQPVVRVALRALAILIAVLAVIDPSVTSRRASKPQVVVVAGNPSRDSALARRVVRSLDKRFNVLMAPLGTADATVLVGEHAPADIRDLAAPLFVVANDRSGSTMAIEAVNAPVSAPLDARVPVTVVARTRGARGKTIDASLSVGGVVVDRVSRPIAADGRAPLTLSFVPTTSGAALLHVAASIGEARDSSTADLAVDIRDTRWSVLFFDPRPSWMSTFVRRAVERDPRFVVTSRIVTSRNVSTDVGAPPSRLDDLAGLSRFDAIVVGAPDAASERDLVGLEEFARRRGGSIVLLYDRPVAGTSVRLTHANAWATRTNSRPLPIRPLALASGSAGDSSALQASEIAWPVVLPPNIEVLARTAAAIAGDSSNNRAALWRTPLGAGRVIVSGALDAWRFRDRSESAFDRLWQTVIAEAAGASPPPLSVRAVPATLAPGEETDIIVTVRDAALRDLPNAAGEPTRVAVSARIAGVNSGPQPIVLRLWPTSTIGEFRTTFRAPSAVGTYRVTAAGEGFIADAPIVVAATASHARPSDVDVLGAWANARGGQVVSNSQVDDLGSMLLRAIRPASRLESWHPMRSVWWILPFALALGGEWLLRRRAGLA